MKIKLLLVSLATFFISEAFSQQYDIERCGTVQYTKYRDNIQSNYISSINEVFENSKVSQIGLVEKSNETYTIPVVVHIVYYDSIQNLPDSVILNQIKVLNEDYGRLNEDTVNLRPDFFPHVGSGNIKFRLADYDPDGNPTSGITRTKTSRSTFLDDISGLLNDDFSVLERVKKTAEDGIDPWDQSRYLNIWVCNMAVDIGVIQLPPMLLGYATPPSNLPNWSPGSTGGMDDGVVIQYQVFGSNNPHQFETNSGVSYIAKGRTVTHEVGHYLGLRHIWGDGDCTEEDGIDDTPNAADKSNSDCDTSKNTCIDTIAGIDLPDMVENYMDYSAETCQNSFTKGQISLMRGVIENNRWELVNENPALNIKKEEIAESIFIYPNPAKNTFTIKRNSNTEGVIFILDLSGKIVQKVPYAGKETVINIEFLESGIYQVYSKEMTRSVKLVKL